MESALLGPHKSHCHQLRGKQSRGNAGTVQSMENDEAVSHPSHRSLEDAHAAGVSHIPQLSTATFMFIAVLLVLLPVHPFENRTKQVGDEESPAPDERRSPKDHAA